MYYLKIANFGAALHHWALRGEIDQGKSSNVLLFVRNFLNDKVCFIVEEQLGESQSRAGMQSSCLRFVFLHQH